MMLNFLDLYCGAGGTSSGIKAACDQRKLDYRLVGLNHWDVAIATHNSNRLGDAREADIYITNPNWAVPGGHLDLLCASPECIFHSVARSGKGPCNDQSRSAAFDIIRWLDCLDVDWLQIENVGEFIKWGPLNKDGYPDKEKEGTLFKEWLGQLANRGYEFEYRILNSADYGAYTSRKRFFLIATKTGKEIKWPEKTHEGKWNAAKDIIDWSIKGQSVFTDKALVRNSMNRICHGLKKFNNIDLDLDYAMECSSKRELPVIKGSEVQPFLTRYNGGEVPRAHSINEPIRTIDTSNRFAVLEPYILPQHQGYDKKRVLSMDKPLPSLTTTGCEGVMTPFLTKYYGTGAGAVSVDDPLATITTKDRFSLHTSVVTECRLDVTHRLMKVHELSAAMGFPKDYIFSGTKTDAKRQIGNAVECNISRALVSTILKQMELK